MMEHYRSTLATTAAAVVGLFVAAHVLHPGNFEEQPRPAKRPDVVAAAPALTPAPAQATAWTDPPADLREAAASASATVAEASVVPRATVFPAQNAAPPSPREKTAKVARDRKIVRAARGGTRQRAARIRRTGPTRVAAATTASPAAQAAERPATTGTSPIGGLMRGLGLDLGS